jgi:hypothetical protein
MYSTGCNGLTVKNCNFSITYFPNLSDPAHQAQAESYADRPLA